MIKKILITLYLMCAVQPSFAAGRGYLGVWFANLPATEKVVRTGVVVKKVWAGSAAERAGLKPGQIVTQIDGISVPDPKTAVAVAGESSAGERVLLTVIDRTNAGVRQSSVVATLAASPPAGFEKIMRAKYSPPSRPLSLSSKASRNKRGAIPTGSPF
jgi:S1-C subfamily serine protease